MIKRALLVIFLLVAPMWSVFYVGYALDYDPANSPQWWHVPYAITGSFAIVIGLIGAVFVFTGAFDD